MKNNKNIKIKVLVRKKTAISQRRVPLKTFSDTYIPPKISKIIIQKDNSILFIGSNFLGSGFSPSTQVKKIVKKEFISLCFKVEKHIDLPPQECLQGISRHLPLKNKRVLTDKMNRKECSTNGTETIKIANVQNGKNRHK